MFRKKANYFLLFFGCSKNISFEGGKFPECATNVNLYFWENGELEFICWLEGHTHRRSYSRDNNQLIITVSTLFIQSYDDQDRDANPTLRVLGYNNSKTVSTSYK